MSVRPRLLAVRFGGHWSSLCTSLSPSVTQEYEHPQMGGCGVIQDHLADSCPPPVTGDASLLPPQEASGGELHGGMAPPGTPVSSASCWSEPRAASGGLCARSRFVLTGQPSS